MQYTKPVERYSKAQISYTHCPGCFKTLPVIDVPNASNNHPDAAIELHISGCDAALHDSGCDRIFARIREARKFEAERKRN